MPNQLHNHLFLDDRFLTAKPYTSNSSGGPKVMARSGINREQQGEFVKVRFEEAVADFNEGIAERDFVYLVFRSAPGFALDIDKFDDKNSFRIAYTKTVSVIDEEGKEVHYIETAIYLDKKAIDHFLNKVEQYLNEFTPQSKDKEAPVPKNNTLIANIGDIRAATLRSFWQEAEIPFPDMDVDVWWEVWMDNENFEEDIAGHLFGELELFDIQVGQQWLKFPEHAVGLIKGTAQQLSETLLYSNRLAELRKPRETADFFTRLDRLDQNEWITDLRQRVVNRQNESIISVCLLDTGVNRGNPLLEDLVPEAHLDTVIPAAGKADTNGTSAGHGTPMAGLILYGDLADALQSPDSIQIFHHLESIKLISHQHPHEPQNYGYVTQEALDRALMINLDHKRIACLAITSDELEHRGQPSSWSAAIDQYSFGDIEAPNERVLVLVSSGNILPEQFAEYPLINHDCSINDPAQAFNAVTVGAYTQRDHFNQEEFPNTELLAKHGSMAVCNTTSVSWENSWCRKPDIVMEGGNFGIQNGSLVEPDSLMLLSTAKGTTLKWLTTFGDTSAATALASRFAAQLYHHYPDLWPETIRALMVHAADWTTAMLGEGKTHIRQLDERSERIKLLQCVGFGVPSFQRARYSADNSLTLISEATLIPLKKVGSDIKTDEFHLYDLPWPADLLLGLQEAQVKLTVTLSYFIEPNPGNKRYAEAKNYMSHGLRFKIIDRLETVEHFAGRISKETREEGYAKQTIANDWLLGEDVRNKGSIHKDIWEGTAADLATRKHIAVYPTAGWWKTRKKLERYGRSVRYSLIVSIEAPDVEVDIYNVVKGMIDVDVQIQITT